MVEKQHSSSEDSRACGCCVRQGPALPHRWMYCVPMFLWAVFPFTVIPPCLLVVHEHSCSHISPTGVFTGRASMKDSKINFKIKNSWALWFSCSTSRTEKNDWKQTRCLLKVNWLNILSKERTTKECTTISKRHEQMLYVLICDNSQDIQLNNLSKVRSMLKQSIICVHLCECLYELFAFTCTTYLKNDK